MFEGIGILRGRAGAVALRALAALALVSLAGAGALWSANTVTGGAFWGLVGDEYVDVDVALPNLQQGDGEYPDDITYFVQLNTDPNLPTVLPLNVTIQETNPRESGSPVVASGAVSLLVPLNDDGTPVRAEPHKLIFHSGNWQTPQPIRIASINDNIDTPDREVDIEHDFGNYLTSPVKLRVTVHDDDERGLMLPETVNVRGLTTETYEFHLATQPQDGENVVIEISGDGLQVAANGGELGSSAQVTFANERWNRPQTISVSSDRRGLSPGAHSFTLMHKAIRGSDYAGEVSDEIDVVVNIAAVVARPHATATPRVLPTWTPRPTHTATPEPAPAAVEPTATATNTVIPTLTPTPSATPTPAPTATFTATPEPTPTPQADDSPPRPVEPDSTATAEAVEAEATATREAAERATATAVAAIDATATAVVEATQVAATVTAAVSDTATAVAYATSTAIAIPTATAEAAATATAVAQVTVTAEVVATQTAVVATRTAIAVTSTAIAELTATAAPVATATAVYEQEATATAIAIIRTAIAIETAIPEFQATATAQAGALATAIAEITATAEVHRRAREMGTALPGFPDDADSGAADQGIAGLLARATAEARELGATATAIAIAQAGGSDPRFNALGTPLAAPQITATAAAQEAAIATIVADSIEATQTAIAGGGVDAGGGDFGREILDIADGAADFLGPLAIPVGVGVVAAIVAATIAVTKKLALAKVFKLVLRFVLRV